MTSAVASLAQMVEGVRVQQEKTLRILTDLQNRYSAPERDHADQAKAVALLASAVPAVLVNQERAIAVQAEMASSQARKLDALLEKVETGFRSQEDAMTPFVTSGAGSHPKQGAAASIDSPGAHNAGGENFMRTGVNTRSEIVSSLAALNDHSGSRQAPIETIFDRRLSPVITLNGVDPYHSIKTPVDDTSGQQSAPTLLLSNPEENTPLFPALQARVEHMDSHLTPTDDPASIKVTTTAVLSIKDTLEAIRSQASTSAPGTDAAARESFRALHHGKIDQLTEREAAAAKLEAKLFAEKNEVVAHLDSLVKNHDGFTYSPATIATQRQIKVIQYRLTQTQGKRLWLNAQLDKINNCLELASNAGKCHCSVVKAASAS